MFIVIYTGEMSQHSWKTSRLNTFKDQNKCQPTNIYLFNNTIMALQAYLC